MRALESRGDDRSLLEAAPEKLYVVFGVGKKTYAMDADLVCEILRECPVAEFPAAGKSVRGAIFFRGACITVFDLGWKLAGAMGRESAGARIIVLAEPGWAALRVDRVVALARDRLRAQKACDGSSARDARFIGGFIEWDQKALDVIDVQKLMASEASERRLNARGPRINGPAGEEHRAANGTGQPST